MALLIDSAGRQSAHEPTTLPTPRTLTRNVTQMHREWNVNERLVHDVVKGTQSTSFRFGFRARKLDQACPSGNLLRDEGCKLWGRAYFCDPAEPRQSFAHVLGLQILGLQIFVKARLRAATVSGDVPASPSTPVQASNIKSKTQIFRIATN
jgi:hypothetical protein